jgi:hypothetical protein
MVSTRSADGTYGLMGDARMAMPSQYDADRTDGSNIDCASVQEPSFAVPEADRSGEVTLRKIVHIDMDAFYASVEQRDDPTLRGRPVVVAWRGKRSVVCAAPYEARPFGVRSAMPAVAAERLCPEAIFLPPDFTRYKAVSRAVRDIFQSHTDLIEPLSLDEAYLDVTENKTHLPTATRVAKTIRQQIREELQLTASAGVAPNKFLAKIASDWRKPDGLFVIQPADLDTFLTPGRTHPRSRKSNRDSSKADRHSGSRRPAGLRSGLPRNTVWPLWITPL